MNSAKRYVVVQHWMEKNEDRILRASGVKNPEEEGSSAKGEAFARLMVATIERHFDSEFSIANLNSAFDLLVSRGLLSDSTPPAAPAPKPKLYYLELHPTGGQTVTKGPFRASDVLAKARFYAREQTAVVIRDEAGNPLDMELHSLFHDPLAQRTAQRQSQQAQADEKEYAEFFSRNRTSAIKSRARTDAGFRDWMARSGQLDFVKASSGGVDEHGRAVEPKKL